MCYPVERRYLYGPVATSFDAPYGGRPQERHDPSCKLSQAPGNGISHLDSNHDGQQTSICWSAAFSDFRLLHDLIIFILIISALLVVASLLQPLAERLKLPHSVLLAAVGVAIAVPR